jgi:hypothetical protein
MATRFVRFRLRSLLLLPVLFAAAWWWVTWPERTARRFVQRLSNDPAAAHEMIAGTQPSDGFWQIVDSERCQFEPPEFQSPSWTEWLRGQRTFQLIVGIDWNDDVETSNLGQFIAFRNKVARPDPGKMYLITYKLRQDADSAANDLSALYQGNDNTLFKTASRGSDLLVSASQQLHGEVKALILLRELESAEVGTSQ